MIDKNVNYAYGPSPVRMAEGGVARQSYAPVEQKREARDFSTPSPNASPPPAPPAEDARKQIHQSPADARGNVVTTIYDQYGNMEGSSNNSQAQVDAGIFGADTNEKYKVVSQLIPQDQNSGGNYAPYSAENRPRLPAIFYGEQPGGMDGGFDFGAPANVGDTHYDPQLDTTYTYQEKNDGRGGLYSGWDITEGTGGIVTGGPALPKPDNPFLNPSPPDSPDQVPSFGINPPPNPFQADPPVSINPPPNPFQPSPPVGINPPVPLPRPDNPFFDPAPPPVFGGPAPVNPFPQLPTGPQGGRTYGNAPVFGGFNPGRNIPTDEFGNPIAVPYSNGGIAGLRR